MKFPWEVQTLVVVTEDHVGVDVPLNLLSNTVCKYLCVDYGFNHS